MEYKNSRLNKQDMSGIIRFDTEPSGARIFIDNRYIGDSPLDISDVKPGHHTYQLNDYKSEGDLIVYDNKILHIKVNLNTNIENKEYINIESTQEKNTKNENQSSKSTPSQSDVLPDKPYTSKSPTSTNKSTEEKLIEHLNEMNKIFEKNNQLMTDIRDTLGSLKMYFSESLGYEIGRKYLNSDLISVKVATPNRPENPDIIANPNTVPPTPGYDRILVHRIIDRNAPLLTVSNEGLTNLFIITSHNGTNWSTAESVILRGEYKRFANVYELRIRSSVAGSIPGSFGEAITSIISGIPTGGVYRISEYTTEHYTRNINRTSFDTFTAGSLVSLPGINVINVSSGINIFSLPVAIRASPTNTDYIFIAPVDRIITNPVQRITLAPGDATSLYIMDGTIVLIATNSDGQGIEILNEKDL